MSVAQHTDAGKYEYITQRNSAQFSIFNCSPALNGQRRRAALITHKYGNAQKRKKSMKRKRLSDAVLQSCYLGFRLFLAISVEF